jgi:hypothetical protein
MTGSVIVMGRCAEGPAQHGAGSGLNSDFRSSISMMQARSEPTAWACCLNRDHRPGSPGTLVPLEQRPMGICRSVILEKESSMSKGNNRRGNKEAKKPKQEKPKPPATADSKSGQSSIMMGGKKVK